MVYLAALAWFLRGGWRFEGTPAEGFVAMEAWYLG